MEKRKTNYNNLPRNTMNMHNIAFPGCLGRVDFMDHQIMKAITLVFFCDLNDGHRKVNEYCEEAITLIKDLLGRQNKHCNEMNAIFFNDKNLLSLEKTTLTQSTLDIC